MKAPLNPPESVLGRFVLENLKSPVLVLDRGGRLVQANRSAQGSEEFELTRLFAVEGDERVRDLLRDLERDGSGSVELTLEQPGGSRRVLLLEGFAVESWFVVVASDRTEQLAQDEELHQLRRAESVSLLAASAAHDLANLLTPILCLSSMLSEEIADGSRAASMVAEVESAAARAASLVRDVLTFARTGSKSMQAVNLNIVVGAMRPLLERVLGNTTKLVPVLDEALGQTLIDRSQLEHVLLNLVTNARYAMPAGGQLTIRTVNVDAETVALIVCDDGVGMSEEVRNSAFERFFTTRAALGGTGLGLASVRRFASDSGGCATLDSEPGKGTTVTVELPRLGPPAEPPAKAAEPTLQSGSEPVLVVDASEYVRRTVRLVLEDRGYPVLEASSTDGAVEPWSRGTLPRVALVDATMAIRDVSFLERLRQAVPGVRVLLMTGDHQVRSQAEHAGEMLLSKAFTASELSKAIRAALDRPG